MNDLNALGSSSIAGGGASGSAAVVFSGSVFEGSNTRLARNGNLTGLSDGNVFTLSAWVKRLDSDFFAIMSNDTGRFDVSIDRVSTGSNLRVRLDDSSGSTILASETLGGVPSSWSHVLISIDTAAGVFHAYINDVAQSTTSGFLSTNAIDFTTGDFFIGRSGGQGDGANGYMYDPYFTDEFIDISIEANRRKFISAAGKPVRLGLTGATPTGTAAKVFCSGAINNWNVNKGTGGGFTVSGNALTVAPDSPTD